MLKGLKDSEAKLLAMLDEVSGIVKNDGVGDEQKVKIISLYLVTAKLTDFEFLPANFINDFVCLFSFCF